MPDKTHELAKRLIALVSRNQGAIKMMDVIKSVGTVRSISIATSFLVLFSSALLLAACDRGNTPASEKVARTPDGTKPLTLERFETQQGTFELGMAPCTPQGCAVEVRWLRANRLISSIALPVPAADQAVEKEETSLDWGADPGLYAWGAGMVGDGQVSTVARPVVFDSDTTGLLLTQRFGFDHISQLHRLVLPLDGKLIFLWEFTDGSDHTWSATVVSATSAITFFLRQSSSRAV